MAAPLAMVGSAIGSIVSAFGAYQGGQAGQAMQNYRAQVANINAQIAQNRADTATVTGGRQAEISGIQTAQRVGGIRAVQGASNLAVGGPLVASQTEVGQLEQNTIRNRAAQEAFGFQTAAFSDTAQQQLDIAAGKQEATAGDTGAVSSILGGATQVSDKWTKYGEAFGGSSSTPNYALQGPTTPNFLQEG